MIGTRGRLGRQALKETAAGAHVSGAHRLQANLVRPARRPFPPTLCAPLLPHPRAPLPSYADKGKLAKEGGLSAYSRKLKELMEHATQFPEEYSKVSGVQKKVRGRECFGGRSGRKRGCKMVQGSCSLGVKCSSNGSSWQRRQQRGRRQAQGADGARGAARCRGRPEERRR